MNPTNTTAAKATMRQLAARMSRTLTQSPEDVENLLRDYFAYIADELATGNTVDIAGLGRFRNDNGIAVFHPDTTLAASVNAPFSCFQAVEVPAGVTLESLLSIKEESTPKVPEPEVIEPIEATQETPIPEDIVNETEETVDIVEDAARVVAPEAPKVEVTPEPTPIPPTYKAPISFPDEPEEYVTDNSSAPEEQKTRSWLSWNWVVSIVAFIVGFAVGFAVCYYSFIPTLK